MLSGSHRGRGSTTRKARILCCAKSSLSANSHVLSTSRARRSRKPQSSGSEARRCYENPSRQLKNEGEKIFPRFARNQSALHTSALASPVAVPLQNTSCRPCMIILKLSNSGALIAIECAQWALLPFEAFHTCLVKYLSALLTYRLYRYHSCYRRQCELRRIKSTLPLWAA